MLMYLETPLGISHGERRERSRSATSAQRIPTRCDTNSILGHVRYSRNRHPHYARNEDPKKRLARRHGSRAWLGRLLQPTKAQKRYNLEIILWWYRNDGFQATLASPYTPETALVRPFEPKKGSQVSSQLRSPRQDTAISPLNSESAVIRAPNNYMEASMKRHSIPKVDALFWNFPPSCCWVCIVQQTATNLEMSSGSRFCRLWTYGSETWSWKRSK